jgi:hypothetical protein
MRTKGHADEVAGPFGRFFHRALSPILIRHDNDPGVGAEVKIPEHMTGRERRNQ